MKSLSPTQTHPSWLRISLAVIPLTGPTLVTVVFCAVYAAVSVPPAAAGGVIGLSLLNLTTFQPLDMLTILGFVILSGIVVNNAILLVHRTLQTIKNNKLNANDAILDATKSRIRPIFMSTLTSVFGMLPLVLFPGAGSELYKGLGSVILGGLSLSAILTLLIIPPMLKIFISEKEILK